MSKSKFFPRPSAGDNEQPSQGALVHWTLEDVVVARLVARLCLVGKGRHE